MYAPLTSTPFEQIQKVINTNLIGTLLCTKEAITLMKNQERPGKIFLVEGAGSTGMPTPKYLAYGASKAGVVQIMKSLNAELKEAGLGHIMVDTVSPGICSLLNYFLIFFEVW